MHSNQQGKRIHPFPFLVTLMVVCICYVPLNGWAADTAVKEEVKEAGAAIAEYSVEQKDAAVNKAKEMMDELDDRMHVWEGRLKEKWGDLKQSSKENYQHSTQELNRQREELAVWYEKMKGSSGDNWEEIKQGFAKAYDSVASSWDKSAQDTGITD